MWLIGHLVKTAFHAFFRILFTVLLCAVLAAGISLLISYEVVQQWPPRPLTVAATIAVAVLAGYAGGLTVLVKEAVMAFKDVEHEIAGTVEKEAGHLAR